MKNIVSVDMQIRTLLFFIIVINSLISSATIVGEKEDLLSSNSKASDIKSGLSFTPNKGQIADMNGNLYPDVLYKGEGNGADVYLRKTGISYVYTNTGEVMHKIDEQLEELLKAGVLTEADKKNKQEELTQKEKIKIHRVDMDFEGANTNCRIINEDKLEGYTNYYYAHCPQGITNVHQYNKVTYKDIYEGVDIKYYGDKANGIKYDLIVQPHADPNQITINWKGANELIMKNEKLIIKTSVNEFYESIPKVYQNINGKIVDVECRYKLEEVPSIKTKVLSKEAARLVPNTSYLVTFELGTYNIELPLIIDPWATYYGGNKEDKSKGVAVDKVGNVAITGYTYSTTLPILAGAFQVTFSMGSFDDAYVVKFNAFGQRLWDTYYGGAFAWNESNGIAIDNADNILITGQTVSASFPTGQIGINVAFQPTSNGSYDAFVVKFDSNGIRQWATLYGGGARDYGLDIATDFANNVVITGESWHDSWSKNFPVGAVVGNNVQQAIFGGGPYDAFVVKFDAIGNRLWATLYGGSSTDRGIGITTDKLGNVIFTGQTGSVDFITSACCGNNIQQNLFGGGSNLGGDAFVVKFNSAGFVQWATFYGGNNEDEGKAITTDSFDNVLITGYTKSPNFPVAKCCTNVVEQALFGGGGYDAFVVKFNSAGFLQWATYSGGGIYDWGWSIKTDANDNVYLLMEPEDVASPSLVDVCSYQPIFNSGVAVNPNGGAIEDLQIIKYTSFGKKICGTYFGGTGEDDLEYGGGIAIQGNLLYVTGSTNGGFPVTTNTYQTIFAGPSIPYYSGGTDGFVAEICTNICESKTTLGLNFIALTNVCANVPIQFTPTISNSCDTTGYKFHWEFSGGNPAISDSINPTVSFIGVGTHDVKLVVTTLCKKDSLTKTNYITTTSCCNLAGQFTKGTAPCSNCGCKEWVLVNAIDGTPPYTYLWSGFGGYDKRYKNKICPGNYTVKVTDKNGCSVDVNVTSP